MTNATVTKKSKNPKAPKLFPDELIDQLLAQVQGKDAESILGKSGLAGQIKKQLAERMLAAELTHHLEAETEQGKAGNHRNGTSPKTVLTPTGELKLDIPRHRQATFEPQLVGKYQRRLPGFDDHIISIYARGMSVREIQGHLLELYGLLMSPDLVSTVTDELLADVEQWQQRPLEAMYPIVYFDALRLNICDEGTVKNKAIYPALGMHMQLREIVKNRGHFPSAEAARKLLYLALRDIKKDWKMPPITWRQAVNQFAILFGERFASAIS